MAGPQLACPGCGRPLEGPAAPSAAEGPAGPLLAECDRCGSASTLGEPPEPVAAHTGATYEPTRGLADALVGPLRRLAERDRLRIVLAGRPAPRSVLEIGCGDGGLLAALTDRGAERAVGIEPTATAGAEPHPGVELLAAGVEEVDLEPGAFELAVLWHSLEHLVDPAAVLRRIREWLSPRGTVVVAVPNRAGLQARIGGDRWFHRDIPRHRSHFTPAGLGTLLDRCGFAVRRREDWIVEGGPLGMWQTLLNLLTRQHNFAFRLLKRDPALRALPRDLAATLVAGAGLAVPASLLELLAARAGAGGTFAVEAQRR